MKIKEHEHQAIQTVMECLTGKGLDIEDFRTIAQAARCAYSYGRTDMISELTEEAAEKARAKWPNE